jgi:hypothetical protein
MLANVFKAAHRVSLLLLERRPLRLFPPQVIGAAEARVVSLTAPP